MDAFPSESVLKLFCWSIFIDSIPSYYNCSFPHSSKIQDRSDLFMCATANAVVIATSITNQSCFQSNGTLPSHDFENDFLIFENRLNIKISKSV